MNTSILLLTNVNVDVGYNCNDFKSHFGNKSSQRAGSIFFSKIEYSTWSVLSHIITSGLGFSFSLSSLQVLPPVEQELHVRRLRQGVEVADRARHSRQTTPGLKTEPVHHLLQGKYARQRFRAF